MPSPSVPPPSSLGAVVLFSAAIFVATNADGLLLLTFFFGHRPQERWRVVAGQFIGFFSIVVLGLCGWLASGSISLPRIGLLGFVPIGLGVHQLWAARARERPPVGPAHLSALRVAVVVFASGADNIAVYIPIFAASSARQLELTLAVFTVLCAVWCALAAALGGHRILQKPVRRFGARLSGAVLIGLGVYILWSSGALR